MNRKMMTATDTRWFGVYPTPSTPPYLFGQEVHFRGSELILAPPQSPLPDRPHRPWLRILISQNPYADIDFQQGPPSASWFDEINWVDFYGESYSFREKKLVVSWSSFGRPSGRTKLSFPPEETHWRFNEICEQFLDHARRLDSTLDHTLQRIREFHINPHPDNRYTDGQQILLFVSGLWLSYNRQTQILSEKIEYPNDGVTAFPALRPIYHEEMIFCDEYLREGSLKSSSEPLIPPLSQPQLSRGH